MRFDETEYREEFLKKHRGARTAPGDLMSRYAITLPATDAEVSAQVKAVRAYWNKVYNGKAAIAHVARLCRAEDERLRGEHGAKMETRAWWQARQSDQQKTAQASITVMADDLRRRYGTLGVVTSGLLGQFAAKLGLSAAQANQAAERADLTVIGNVTLPMTEPIGNFNALLKSMSECAVPSVPELVHPGSGTFRLIDRYECLTDPRKRLDAVAVDAQSAEADKRGISATEDARRTALKILRKALRDGVDLRDLALYHMMAIARESASVSTDIAAGKLREAGLDTGDAAVIAVLVAEHGASTGTGAERVPELLAAGRLREAKAAAASLPSEGERMDAMQRVEAAQQRLDQLIAAAKAALAVPDEMRAESLLKEAGLLSVEDAAVELAAVPLPPPADLRAVGEGGSVKLFWRPAPGHDQDTVYVVRRTTQTRLLTGPTEGEQVHRDRGDTCADTHAPVARPVQYAVFAAGDGRPSSRPASVAVTLLPPVSQLQAEVGPATVALHWSAHPDAQVKVTRTAPGAVAVPVRATGNSCQVSGLAEGQPQHFEVTAVYAGPDGAELRSAAEHISATPRAEARPISTLRAHPVGTDGAIRVRVTWLPVDNSEVRILRTDREPAMSFGKVVSADEMARVGTEVTGALISAGRETGFETALPPGVHRLVPFSIGGTGIVMGKPTTVAVTDPVRDLSVTPFIDYATVSWEWPASAQVAEVSWRLDGEEDVVYIDRGQYRSAGGVKIPLGRGPCEVEVRAVITVGRTSFTSPPVSAKIAQVVEAAIGYDVFDLLPSVGPLRGRSKKVVFVAEQACSGVRVRMVASPSRVMPTSPSDGETVLDTVLTLRSGVAEERKVAVPRKTVWVRCFIVGGQARLIDPPITSLKE
ncbi:MAG: hypothetical protein JO345_39080 [Streptosporangiaceae bacterium]|nr:hypothetical protein [Streptosporangiaceae bacterium]